MTDKKSDSSPRHLDVVTIGESMILVTPSDGHAVDTADLFALHVGGAESNVAVHLHQLGHSVTWVSAVGTDALGRRLERILSEMGLDMTHVRKNPDAPTGLYVKDPGKGPSYYRAGSAASRMGPEMMPEELLQSAKVVHLTGITPALSDTCRALAHDVAHRARQAGTIISLDVNYRSALWPTSVAGPELSDLCRLADVVFVGLDEAHELWGCETPSDVRGLFPNVDSLVVKNDSTGAFEFSSSGEVFVPSLPVEVVEAVGAGDAFAAGYLSGMLKELSSESRLARGHERAAKTLVSIADVPTDVEGKNS